VRGSHAISKDILAHRMSRSVLQAEAAQATFERDSDKAGEQMRG
jgi:hypothetical protein